VEALENDVRQWIKRNQDPKPFVWTKTVARSCDITHGAELVGPVVGGVLASAGVLGVHGRLGAESRHKGWTGL
jgi:hypothetical protein